MLVLVVPCKTRLSVRTVNNGWRFNQKFPALLLSQRRAASGDRAQSTIVKQLFSSV
jgi:hypothetical protein